MGASITSGSVKYVFTQATAPSGEGEVEGSLWYDITISVLYVYDGSMWVRVATTDAYKIIQKGTLSSAATLTISNIPTGYSHLKLVLSGRPQTCLLYTSPSPRDGLLSRMPSSA